jgi:hypothetical protein
MTQILHGKRVQFCLTLGSKFGSSLCQILPITTNEKSIADSVSYSCYDAYNAVLFHFYSGMTRAIPNDRKLYQRKETYYDFNSLSKPRIVTVVRSGSLEQFEG